MGKLTEDLLREALKEAQDKNQPGFLIWTGNRICLNFVDALIEKGNEHYDFAMSQVMKGECGTITYDLYGIKLPAAYIIAVQKLQNSDESFQMILEACKKYNDIGPILLIPNNQYAECSYDE